MIWRYQYSMLVIWKKQKKAGIKTLLLLLLWLFWLLGECVFFVSSITRTDQLNMLQFKCACFTHPHTHRHTHTHAHMYKSVLPCLGDDTLSVVNGCILQRDLHYYQQLKTNLESPVIPWPGKIKADTQGQLELCTSQRRCRTLLMKQDTKLQTSPLHNTFLVVALKKNLYYYC